MSQITRTMLPPLRWRLVAILMAFTFMNYMNRIGMSVAGSDIRSTYGLSETEFGSVISAFLLFYTIAMLPCGWLSDRLGARWALAITGLGTALFCAATGVLGLTVPASLSVAMLWLLWLVRASMGIFTAPLFPAAGRVVSRWIPFGQRARVNAYVTGASMVGSALSYPLYGAIMDRLGWPAAFLCLALVTAMLAVVWSLTARDDPRDHPAITVDEMNVIETGGDQVAGYTSDSECKALPSAIDSASRPPETASRRSGPWRVVVLNRSLWILTASYAAVGYVEYLVFYWSEHYFRLVLNFSDRAGRIAAMIPLLCLSVSMPLGGWLCDRLLPVVGYRRSRAVVAMGGMIGCAASLLAATVVVSESTVVACFALALTFIGFTEAPAWATAIDLGGPQAATSAAIANTGGNAGGTLSPIATPWISALLVSQYGMSSAAGWTWGMRLAAFICLAGAVLWFWIDASERVTE